MAQTSQASRARGAAFLLLAGGAVALAEAVWTGIDRRPNVESTPSAPLDYQPRRPIDSGYTMVTSRMRWDSNTTLQQLAQMWHHVGYRHIADIDRFLERDLRDADRLKPMVVQAILYNYEGEPRHAAEVLGRLRRLVEANDAAAAEWLYTLIFYQGVTGLRLGENENCVACRGASSCILPIDPAAMHKNPEGSQLAIRYFSEYLERFPDDLGAKWLLNLAHMTLGTFPDRVEPRFRISLDRFTRSEFDIGKFVDIGDRVGVNRFNWAGGAVMEDFDNDGLLDLVVTSSDPTQPMAYYRNQGDGTFADRTEAAGLLKQLGGLYCVQTDYNNDGHMDIFIARGGWLPLPMRPSLLRNNGDGTFSDVTEQAGLADAVNAGTAVWADYDNDGLLDLFIACETSPSRLYHNRGDGTFEEVAARAGVQVPGRLCKGAAWIDFDNDGYPDLFLNFWHAGAQLFRNNRDGTFTDVTAAMGIAGPNQGFSCWAFDFDNDGWLDIFAASFDRTLEDVVKGLVGQPHERDRTRLYRNLSGKGFQDVTREAGLDHCFATMGSNFADFDNDGWLDIYLATGEPDLSMLVPNRMFKNVAGQRFAEITASSGTGHLQKGHGVACGDWDRDGGVDLFVEAGGTVPGDRYHNSLFQNPGQGNHWLTVKLIGKQTNRAAIGARIKAVTTGDASLTVHRHVSSGSSFGGNPLQQTIGVGKATLVARLEVYWPTSRTTQVFTDVAVDQAIEVTEFAESYRALNWTRVPLR
jgi:hypothetical protein